MCVVQNHGGRHSAPNKLDEQSLLFTNNNQVFKEMELKFP